jgi:predicted signal transduction protein with EAL and GGDEF domain
VRHRDLVARLGGDEFAIIQIEDAAQPAAARALAERLVREFAKPFEIGGHVILVGASVGVALTPEDGTDPDELLKKADLALYDAKMDGRGTFSFFRPEMLEAAQVRRRMEADLREAEAKDELELHYQPIVSLSSQKIVAFEALLRWRHPARGLVMPEVFIPIAEETGLIAQLGGWVLRRAFADAARWPPEISVAINLSPVQVRDSGLARQIGETLQAVQLDPHRVELEITESVLLAENGVNLSTLHQLHALGVKICLDDFGVGYSSLSYLRSFPFQKIKIDRSFVRDVVEQKEAAAIVLAITSLCKSLNMAVTAEGVETPDQVSQVRRLGCDAAQGYLIGRPLPGSGLDALLDQGALGERKDLPDPEVQPKKKPGRRDWIRKSTIGA